MEEPELPAAEPELLSPSCWARQWAAGSAPLGNRFGSVQLGLGSGHVVVVNTTSAASSMSWTRGGGASTMVP